MGLKEKKSKELKEWEVLLEEHPRHEASHEQSPSNLELPHVEESVVKKRGSHSNENNIPLLGS